MSGLCPHTVLLCYLFCIQQTYPNTISCTVDIISTYFDITWQVRSGAVPDIEQSRESWFRQVAVWCGIHDDSRSASSASDLFYPFLSFSCFCMLLHGFEFVSKISMEIGFLYMLPVLPLMLYSFCQILGRGQPASTASQFLLVTLTSNVIGKYWKHMQRDCCCLRSWNS